MGPFTFSTDPKYFLAVAARLEASAVRNDEAGKPHLAAIDREEARHARGMAEHYTIR